MLNTLEEQGYLLKDEGRYTPEFVFYKTLPLAGDERTRIRAICRVLHERTGKQVEVIGVSGRDLYWHEAISDPDAPVRVVAGPGFRRTLYELDAPSRLHLAAMFGGDAGAVIGLLDKAGFDPDGFYRTGLDYRKSNREETAAIIAGTSADACVFDMDGNSNGIRRFAALIRRGGAVLAVLALAEAATPRSDPNRHFAEVSNLLTEARSDIERFLDAVR
jgi:DNA-binding IclR family transcriptional regulator